MTKRIKFISQEYSLEINQLYSNYVNVAYPGYVETGDWNYIKESILDDIENSDGTICNGALNKIIICDMIENEDFIIQDIDLRVEG